MNTPQQTTHSFLTRHVLASRFVRTPLQANLILIAFSLACLAAAAFNVAESTGTFEPTVYREDVPADVREQMPANKLAELPSRG